MLRPLIPTLICTLSATTAQAACPVAADLETGIRFTFEDDIVIDYTAPEPGIVDEAELEPDGSTYHIVTERGILEISSFSRGAGAKKASDVTRYTYDFDTSEVFPLTPGKNGGGQQLAFDEKGEQIDEASIVYGIGAPETFSAGPCDYEAIPVQLNMRFSEGDPLVIRLAYLPALDFAVIRGYYEWGYDPTLYVPVSVEPLSAQK